MINIKSKEYNLSSLFQYDLLRDILLSLSEYQNEINSEIIALKKQTKYHEMRLTNLEEKNDIKINLPDFSTTITNIEAQKNVENVNNNNEIPQKDENKNKEEEIKKEEIKEDNKTENKIELDKNKKEEKESKDNSDEEEIKFPKRKRKKRQSTKFGELINDNFIVNYSLNNSPQSQKNSELNLELIGEMMKKIRENTEKIANLETDINKLIEKQLKKTTGQFQKDIRNELLENKSNFTNLDNRINELLQKTEEHEKLIEELTVKSSNIDIYKMVQDNGDGNVDMVKILVKSLEERVFKKFEIIDLRYKQEAGELLRSRKALESLNVIAEKNEREINDLKEGERSWKEELDNLKNTINEKDKTIQELIEGKENNQNQKIAELKNVHDYDYGFACFSHISDIKNKRDLIISYDNVQLKLWDASTWTCLHEYEDIGGEDGCMLSYACFFEYKNPKVNYCRHWQRMWKDHSFMCADKGFYRHGAGHRYFQMRAGLYRSDVSSKYHRKEKYKSGFLFL